MPTATHLGVFLREGSQAYEAARRQIRECLHDSDEKLLQTRAYCPLVSEPQLPQFLPFIVPLLDHDLHETSEVGRLILCINRICLISLEPTEIFDGPLDEKHLLEIELI